RYFRTTFEGGLSDQVKYSEVQRKPSHLQVLTAFVDTHERRKVHTENGRFRSRLTPRSPARRTTHPHTRPSHRALRSVVTAVTDRGDASPSPLFGKTVSTLRASASDLGPGRCRPHSGPHRIDLRIEARSDQHR